VALIAVVSAVSENQIVLFYNLTKNLSTLSTSASFPNYMLPIEFLNFCPPCSIAHIIGSKDPFDPATIIGMLGKRDLSSKASEATLNHPDLSTVSKVKGTNFLPEISASGPTLGAFSSFLSPSSFPSAGASSAGASSAGGSSAGSSYFLVLSLSLFVRL
jgi:hypothetical protein